MSPSGTLESVTDSFSSSRPPPHTHTKKKVLVNFAAWNLDLLIKKKY